MSACFGWLFETTYMLFNIQISGSLMNDNLNSRLGTLEKKTKKEVFSNDFYGGLSFKHKQKDIEIQCVEQTDECLQLINPFFQRNPYIPVNSVLLV